MKTTRVKTCHPFLPLLLAALLSSPAAAKEVRPNILLILSDDHAKQALSCYGNTDIQTPALDRLAAEGMRFEHALTPNSFCTPSRAAVLTGKYSHKNGVAHLNQKFDGSQQTFPKLLQKAGQPIPDHCDGIDLFPYLKGEQTGDAHEYLFWLNNEPGDAVRRHLIAVRWNDWRLYKQHDKDPWQLFDLKKDPREESDLAAEHPDVVKQMAAKHTAWAKTLEPLGKIPEIPAGDPIIPKGHGWAIAPAKASKGTK